MKHSYRYIMSEYRAAYKAVYGIEPVPNPSMTLQEIEGHTRSLKEIINGKNDVVTETKEKGT